MNTSADIYESLCVNIPIGFDHASWAIPMALVNQVKMKKISQIVKEIQRSAKLRAHGISIALLIAALLAIVVVVFYRNHQDAIASVISDPLALGYFLGAWLLSVLLLNGVRAALDVQYFRYLMGRIDELVYLQDWKALIPVCIAIPSVAWSYYSEPWSLSAQGGSIVAISSTCWAMYQFIRDVAGVWLARGDEVYFYPNENLLEQNRYESDVSINAHFRDETSPLWRVEIKIKDGDFSISPEPLLRARRSVFVLVRSKGGLLFNESKIRLCTDIPANGDFASFKSVTLQKTSYFDTLCTNDIVGYRIRTAKKSIDANANDHDDDLGTGLEDYFIGGTGDDGTNQLVKFGTSKLSNHMGGSTLVIDSLGYIHLTKQGRSSVIAAGKLTSTGSGSFDWSSKVRNGQPFCELIRGEIERELREETGLNASSIKHTYLLGMARHRARGGKPEFFAVTLVTDMQATVTEAEFGLTDNHYQFSEPLSRDPVKAIEQLNIWQQKHASICSSSLILNFKLLVEDPGFLGRILAQIESS